VIDPSEIRGILPIIHMPYHEDQSIDFTTLQREIDYVFDTGAHGFGLALVSDTLRLTAQERLEMPAHLVRFAAGRGPVVISVGAESTAQARAFARAAEDGGASAIMAIPPLSQGLAEPELRGYFEELLDEIDIGVFVQDASSYVGKAMSLELQAELFLQHGSRVLFKPEATPLGPCISGLVELTGGKAAIFEGSGGQLLIDSYRRGVVGTMPGVEMLDGLVALWNACEAGDWDRAYEVYYPVCAIVTLQIQGGLDGFIVSERHMLNRQGLFPNQVHRSPVAFHLDEGTRQEIDRLYDRLQAVLAT
jgi:2-keto-3-deoxy-L-arabinonate dehydratase